MIDKNLITFGIILMLLIVGLSGCNDTSNSDNTNKNVESQYINIYDIKVETITYKWTEGEQTFTGFHKPCPDGYNCHYKIQGKVKNIYNKPIERVSLRLYLYDSIGNELCTESDSISSLYLDEIESFVFVVSDYEYDYFEYVTEYNITHSVKLE